MSDDTEQTPVSETSRAYNALRSQIITTEIPPGERLKVETLKGALNIGASPIREALSLLTSDQLVDRLDRRGFRAAPVGSDQFSEILMLRCALEDLALAQSLAKGDSDWEENLVLAHHRLSRADRTDARSYEDIHKAFHMALLEACGSPILMRFCSQLYDLNIRYRHLANKADSYGKRDIAQEHEDILNAAVDRDLAKTSETLRSHYTRTGEFLLGFLEVHPSVGNER